MTSQENLLAWLVGRVAELRNLPVAEVDPDRPLTELGMSSRDAVTLSGDLGKLLGRPLPPTLAWESPTISALVASLTGEDTGRDQPLVAAAVAPGEPVAVVGLGVRLAGGVDSPEAFWSLLSAGEDAISEVPAGRWEDFAPAADLDGLPRLGGFLDDVAGFDAAFFGITPREAEAMDPQQRLLLEVSWAALEDAGIAPASLRGSRTGVFVGLSATEYGHLTMVDLPSIDAWSGTGAAASIAANRLSYQLDLRGPSMTVDTACSSSLVAVHHGVQSLQRGETDHALVGGVNLLLSPAVFANFTSAGVLAADGRCKAFDAAADGIVRGEGCGVVVLKRLTDARRDGDRVLAVIRASAVNSDGRSNGMMAPNPDAQAALLRDAYSVAELDPSGVDYVEAHGTGTFLGDPIEAGALGAVLGKGRAADRPLLLGSVKSNLGHLEGAAGIAGLIKVVLAMKYGRLPASLHYTAPNPNIDFDGNGLRVIPEPTPWPRYSGLARAGVSAFGFGGTNAHVVLEEWPAKRKRVPRGDAQDTHVLALSARSATALAQRAVDLADWLAAEENAGVALGAVASTLARRREHLAVRGAVVGTGRESLVDALRALGAGEPRPDVRTGTARRDDSDVVFVFSGYGSQWDGMGRTLLATEPAFRAAVEELDPAFVEVTGFSLRAVLAGEQQLPDLAATQPTLFGIQVALAALWRAHGVEPAAVVGHSMGEVAAAVVAGALSVADGLRVMTTRARLLSGIDASGVGAMAVVELSPAELAELEAQWPSITVAVYASPTQCTVSGEADQVGALVAHVEGMGRLARRLKVGGAGHSPAVDAVLDEFRAGLADLEPSRATVPCYTSVLDDPREAPAFDVEYWAKNLRRPVRFAHALSAAIEDRHTRFVEVSPHPIALAALEQTSGGKALGLPSAHRKDDERTTFLTSLAALHTTGHPTALAARHAAAPPVSLPGPRWEHHTFWPRKRASASTPAGRHPLLGVHIELPEGDRHVWRADVGTDAHPWLTDHAAHGVAIFPGTGYLELALAAAREAFGGKVLVEVRDVELTQVLPLAAHTEITTSLTLTGKHAGVVTVSAKSAAGTWTRHASATVRRGDTAVTPLGETTDGQAVDLYPALAEMGQAYGPAFRGLRSVVAGSGTASAAIALPGEAGRATGHVLHPALSDASLHALAAAAFDKISAGGGTYLPLSLGAVRVLGDPGTAVRVDARLDSLDEGLDGLVGAVQLLDADGAVVVDVTGVYVRRMQRSSVPLPLSAKAFEFSWERADLDDTAADGQTWVVVAEGEPGDWLTGLRDRLPGGEVLCLPRVDQLTLAGRTPAGVVFVAEPGTGISPQAAQAHVLAVSSLVAQLTDQVDPGWQPPRLWIVTRGAAAVGADEAGSPDLAALRGLARVLAFENPELRATVVDLDADLGGDTAAEGDWVAELAAELTADDAADEVAWRGGVRHIAKLAKAEVDERGEGHTVRDGGYVVTGGLGGLGLLAGKWLAENGATRVVLSGRRGLTEETEPLVAELRGLGAEVEVVAGDVAEAGVADRLVAAATAGGVPLRGVLHAAGVLADGATATLDGADVAKVWHAKATGALALHEATLGHDLDWWLMYSSAAALFGSPGQGAYATANAWLDALVTWRRSRGLTATTVNWGAWAEVGGAVGRDNPVLDPLGPQEGMEALEAVLASGRAATGVARLDLGTTMSLFPQLATRPFFELVRPAEQAAATGGPAWAGMSELRALEPAAARQALEDHLVAIIAELMGFAAERIDRYVPLTQLGLDSLLAMRARGAVERDFGLPLPVPLLLRGASLAEIADHLAEASGLGEADPADRAARRSGGAPAKVGPRDPSERWVARIWQDVLETGEPGVDDNFFALGDAAQADAVYAAIERELDSVPDYGTLFSEPTVAAMADLLRDQVEGNGGKPLRVLRASETGTPVFLFHPAGGPTSVYRSLVQLMGEGVPVYGFERLDDVDTLEEKAQRYLELLREVQPSGPYRLGGWSFGGLLSYEIAQLLTAAGEHVELVAMIDTILPLESAEPISQQDLLLDRFGRFAEHIEETYGVKLDLGADKLGGLDDEQQIRYIIDTLAANVSGMGAAVLHHQYTSYVDARVAENYQPRPYGGRVVLFRAKEPHPLTTQLDPRYKRTDDTLGWDEFAPALEVVKVPGDHLSMIDPPNVAVIARELRAALDHPRSPAH
ncbi:SDR family NAD(P)-dependent oxidoreductase [Actinokineospora sp. PR83]|uniref:type I polyketide synthase n=1 Tax=Actinokineospora sp. PR83 TaxID=2884908 RepID=UPI001F492760|nr:type I polyketide synthase [Actinokineospora sp. PR83]MCG8918745.1 SDR family NAD(P)-dependent oxidoreductase [Actinokineospora sp. PR83]